MLKAVFALCSRPKDHRLPGTDSLLHLYAIKEMLDVYLSRLFLRAENSDVTKAPSPFLRTFVPVVGEIPKWRRTKLLRAKQRSGQQQPVATEISESNV